MPFSVDESFEWMKKYKTGMSLDDLHKEFDKEDVLIQLGLVYAIWSGQPIVPSCHVYLVTLYCFFLNLNYVSEKNAENCKLEPLLSEASISQMTLKVYL